MSKNDGMVHIVEMFGSASKLARATGYSRSYVSRLVNGVAPVTNRVKVKIIEAGEKHGLNLSEVAYMIVVENS